MKDKRFIIILTIVFIILFIFFLSIRCEKIIIGNNKLNKNYIKIYYNDKIILSEFLDIKYEINNKKYVFEQALKGNIISIDKMNLNSTKKEEYGDYIVYYFDKNSRIRTNKNFQIIMCNENIIYIVDGFNKEENICLKTID